MINRMRLHRIIARADADHIDPHVRGRGIAYLMADGTGFPKKKAAKKKGTSAEPPKEEEKIVSIFGLEKDWKSDLKIVLGLTLGNEIFQVGIWAKKNWKLISEKIKKANNHPLVKPKPIAEILLCDGEKGLIDHMEN
jgi:hypothetical protein